MPYQVSCDGGPIRWLGIRGTVSVDDILQETGTLAGTNITSAGLERLERLHRLEILDLSETNFVSGLALLPKLDNLQHLLLREVDLERRGPWIFVRLLRLRRRTLVGKQREWTGD